MPQRILFHRLVFAYGSAASIIGILVLLAQAIIQFQLYTEVSTRDLASTMSLQELHSQHLLRNSIMTLVRPQDEALLNPLHVDPAKQIAQDLLFMEATNTHLLGGMTPPTIVARIQTIQPDFVLTDTAGHQLLTDIQKHDIKDQGKQVQIIFVHEQAYLSGVYSAFVILTGEADGNITIIRLLELILCIIALGTLTFEAFCIVIPAIRDYKHALDKIDAVNKQIVAAREQKHVT